MTTLPTNPEKTFSAKVRRYKRLQELADWRDSTAAMLNGINEGILAELAQGYAEGASRRELAPAIRRTEATIRDMEKRAAA